MRQSGKRDKCGFPIDYLMEFVRDRVQVCLHAWLQTVTKVAKMNCRLPFAQIDNLLVLSNDGSSPPGVDDFLLKV